MKREKAALIDEPRCIGCTRCIEVCPVDAIVGAQGLMHTVVESWCIGCALCPPACPVDCIDMRAPRGILRKNRLKRAGAVAGSTPEERRRILAQVLSRKRG
jgi:RnfABCDGE-type electron transport complex B subunit